MNKHYAVSDLHGCLDLWKMIDEYTDDTDIIYVLGDCGDRGPHGWETIKAVYNSPKTIYLKGNHEDMLAKAMLGDTTNCFWNGGENTFFDWFDDENKEGINWANELSRLPLVEAYYNKNNDKIILCHAGITPYNNGFYPLDYDYLWDRYHFDDEWEDCGCDVYVIHGHTPVPLMADECDTIKKEDIPEKGCLWYSPDGNGTDHKCDIDCGAFWTNHTTLLDLDTFEQHIFEGENTHENQR